MWKGINIKWNKYEMNECMWYRTNMKWNKYEINKCMWKRMNMKLNKYEMNEFMWKRKNMKWMNVCEKENHCNSFTSFQYLLCIYKYIH